jgi:mono/diheme cytochrome c family protein
MNARIAACAATAAVVAVAVVLPSAGGTAGAKDDPTVSRGRALFASIGCYQCHGYAGQGGAAGPRIAALPWPQAAFTAFLRHPAREMPPYTVKVLSDADAGAIYAYVHTLPSPPAAASK